MRLASFTLLCILSLGIAAYALVVYGFLPLGAALHPDMRATYEIHRVAIYTHVFAASVALLLGPFQFSSRLRSMRPKVHRWMGRFYLAAGVLLGGLTGFFMAFHAFGGLVARTGFACLALVWLYTGLRAYQAIRVRNVVAHRRWMIRNFSLSFAAVTLRIWLPLSIASGIPFESAYPVIAWLCWIPNLLTAEFLLRRNARPGDLLRS